MEMSVSELREHRHFFQYLAGNFTTLTCVWMQRVAILLITWDLTQSFMWSGVISLLQLMPTILLGPIFGVQADRWQTSSAMIIVQLIFFALALVIYILQVNELLSIEMLAMLALAIGVTTSAHHPLRMSLTPSLVSKTFLPKAIALDSINFNLTRMVGPAIGGTIIAKWGMAAALLVGVLGYLPLIVALSLLPRLASLQTGLATVSIRHDISQALEIIRADHRIRKALLVTVSYGLFARGFVELFPAIADGVFMRGATGAGHLMAASGLGAICGALFLTTRFYSSPDQRQRLADVSAIVSPNHGEDRILLGRVVNSSFRLLSASFH
jgi:MFS family permease